MRFFGGLLGVLFIFALVMSVAALPQPTVTFIPDTLAENSSFVISVDPGIYNRPVRATWTVIGITDTDMGLFPRVGNKWTCYFSSTDKDADCGPTPFIHGFSNYDMNVKTVDAYGNSGNISVEVSTGLIKLAPLVTVTGSRIDILIFPSGPIPTSVTYAVYEGDFSLKDDYSPLNFDTNTGYYRGSTTITAPGTYYIAFKAVDGLGNFGGGVEKITVGSGSSGGGIISGEIQTDAVSFSVFMNATQTAKRTNYEMQNIGTQNLTGISVVFDAAYSNRISITPVDDSLNPNESTFFTVEISNMAGVSSMLISTRANITFNGTVVGQIPVNVSVSVLNECGSGTGTCPPCNCPPAGSGGMSITPTSFSGDFQVGDTASRTFNITNSGDSEMTSLTYNTGTLSGTATVTLPSTIPQGGEGVATISLTPSSSGSYSGIITISSGSGSVSVPVSANFFVDSSDDIDYARLSLTELADFGVSSDVISGISALLDSAEDNIGYGNFKAAEEEYKEASAKIDVVLAMMSGPNPPPPPNGGGDNTGIIIILVILLAGLGGGLFYIKKIKSKTGGGDEEELEEDISDLEGEGY